MRCEGDAKEMRWDGMSCAELRRRKCATRRACDSVDDVVDAESAHRRCLARGRGAWDEPFSRRWGVELERAAGDDGGDDDDDDERDDRDERWDADETGATALA